MPSASANVSAPANASASASASASTDASADGPAPSTVIAIRAALVEAKPEGQAVPLEGCQELFVAVTKGKVSVNGDPLAELAESDVAVLPQPNALRLKGTGTAVVAHVLLQPSECQADGGAPVMKIVRGQKTPPLRWAKGAMSAWLDVGPDVSKRAYLGRLVGSAPVAEHVHKDSWELIYASDASGTFVLDGKEQKLGPKQVVVVPPNTKHEWRPDPGSVLRAIQVYAPRGPEQRFKGLAAADADAGGK
jgi:quercetin dioxygenase-like cupin family protein